MPNLTRRSWGRTVWLTGVLLGVAGLAGACRAEGYPAARNLPEFTLKDPTGAGHPRAELLERGAVIVVTIPNVKHGAFQDKWKRSFLKPAWPANGPCLVFLEDLSQSNVREKAVKGMKDGYNPKGQVLVLVDETGATRTAFRVQGDETAVLVYDRAGQLVHAVAGLEAPDDVDVAAKQVRKAAEGITAAAAPAEKAGVQATPPAVPARESAVATGTPE